MWGRIAACVFALAVLAGCARSNDRQVVHFWVMGQEGEAVARMLPEFERRHPGIEVRLQQLPWTAAHEKLLTAFAGDALPDVVPLGNTWIPEFAALDALEPLDARIAAQPGFDAADFYAGAWDSGVIDNRTYAVPWYVETRLPYYRRDLLEKVGVAEPPRDWVAWRAAMRAVRDGGGSEFGILLPTNEFEPLLNLAVQQGEPLLRELSTKPEKTLTPLRSISSVRPSISRSISPSLSSKVRAQLSLDVPSLSVTDRSMSLGRMTSVMLRPLTRTDQSTDQTGFAAMS